MKIRSGIISKIIIFGMAMFIWISFYLMNMPLKPQETILVVAICTIVVVLTKKFLKSGANKNEKIL